MSLYDRLDLTKPSRKLKAPIWERINLERPPKPRCQACCSHIQTNWRVCPFCGWSSARNDGNTRHCIWIDISGISIDSEDRTLVEVLAWSLDYCTTK